jgi:hypothetical protein
MNRCHMVDYKPMLLVPICYHVQEKYRIAFQYEKAMDA